MRIRAHIDKLIDWQEKFAPGGPRILHVRCEEKSISWFAKKPRGQPRMYRGFEIKCVRKLPRPPEQQESFNGMDQSQ